MNFLNIFEGHVAGIFGAARAPFSFKKLAKQAAHEMEDQTLVVNGTNTAPALYTILVAADDDPILAPYYLKLAHEVSDFVKAQAEKKRYIFVGEPLVRFMIDPSLRAGRFSVFAENVDAPTLGRLYEEERAYQNGISQSSLQNRAQAAPAPQPVQSSNAPEQQAAPAASDVPAIDPLSAESVNQAIPVPQTISRDALAGLGGAAAAVGTPAGAAQAEPERPSVPEPPKTPTAQLVDVVTGATHQIAQAQCVVGREHAIADVVLNDPNVSRRHAELTFTGSDWTIEDLNSTNGTLVNNRRITRCPLRNGDLLTFGLSTFEFRG